MKAEEELAKAREEAKKLAAADDKAKADLKKLQDKIKELEAELAASTGAVSSAKSSAQASEAAIAKLKKEKEDAVREQDFSRAGELRDKEVELRDKIRSLLQ